MVEFVIAQYKLIVIASALKSKHLLSFASTFLSIRKVNNIIDKCFDKYLTRMQADGMCKKLGDNYVFDEHITRIANVCDGYIKKIEVLERIDRKNYESVETIFVASDSMVSMCYDKRRREFFIGLETEEVAKYCCKKFKMVDVKLSKKEAFEIELDDDDLTNLLKAYGAKNLEYFDDICSQKDIIEEHIKEFAKAVYAGGNRITLLIEHNFAKNLTCIYYYKNKYFWLKMYAGKKKVDVICNDGIGITEKIIYN